MPFKKTFQNAYRIDEKLFNFKGFGAFYEKLVFLKNEGGRKEAVAMLIHLVLIFYKMLKVSFINLHPL